VYGAVTKIVGAAVHARQGTVDFRLTWRLAVISVPVGLAGVGLVHWLPLVGVDADGVVRRALGAVLIVVALVMLGRLFGVGRRLVTDRVRSVLQGRGTGVAGGLVGGAVGVTSVGSGTLLVPFLVAVHPLSPARVVGTDVFHAALLMTATGLAHAYGGTVNWSVASVLLAGSLPGVVLGGWMAPRLPVRVLRVSLAGLLLVSGVTLL
jgi:uncharacterized protein